MRTTSLSTFVLLGAFACAGPQQAASPPATVTTTAAVSESKTVAAPEAKASASTAAEVESTDFKLQQSDSARAAQGATPSKIAATRTEAAMKFVVVDKDKGPVKGIVIALTDPSGTKFYTEETDASGYAEVLVPVGRKYDLVYLSLGRKDISASVTVTDEPNQNVRLTLRYKRPFYPPAAAATPAAAPSFTLDGVNFDTGKATLRHESYTRLDSVLEFLLHKKHSRIEISGHTDNVGNPKANKALSQARARACRDYLIAKGIDPNRIVAVGIGDERPVASNDDEKGRQKNRRIEATEL